MRASFTNNGDNDSNQADGGGGDSGGGGGGGSNFEEGLIEFMGKKTIEVTVVARQTNRHIYY